MQKKRENPEISITGTAPVKAANTVIKIKAANGPVADIIPSSETELREITERFDDRGTKYRLEFQPVSRFAAQTVRAEETAR